MTKTSKIIGSNIERTPLRTIIKQSPSLSKEQVKTLYGNIGVDIFEGKEKISILSDKYQKTSKSLMDKILKWCKGKDKLDYEESDSMRDLVNKYLYNQTFGTFDEIEKNFGKEGLKVIDIYRLMGYIT